MENFFKNIKKGAKKAVFTTAVGVTAVTAMNAESAVDGGPASGDPKAKTEVAKDNLNRENETNPTDNRENKLSHLLTKYQLNGICVGISTEEFEEKYRNRDTDPAFKIWAKMYAKKVNKPIPEGYYVVQEWKVKPLITLSETQIIEKKKQNTNYDLFSFSVAFKMAKADGLKVFTYKGNDYAVTHDPQDIEGTVPGAMADRSDGEQTEKITETKKWDEVVSSE